MITYNSIQRIATGHEVDNTTDFLLDYFCFKEHYNMIAIDLSKFTGNPKRKYNSFRCWRSKRKYFGFLTSKSKSIVNLFRFNIALI